MKSSEQRSLGLTVSAFCLRSFTRVHHCRSSVVAIKTAVIVFPYARSQHLFSPTQQYINRRDSGSHNINKWFSSLFVSRFAMENFKLHIFAKVKIFFTRSGFCKWSNPLKCTLFASAENKNALRLLFFHSCLRNRRTLVSKSITHMERRWNFEGLLLSFFHPRRWICKWRRLFLTTAVSIFWRRFKVTFISITCTLSHAANFSQFVMIDVIRNVAWWICTKKWKASEAGGCRKCVLLVAVFDRNNSESFQKTF